MQNKQQPINVVTYIRESTSGQMLHGHRPETQRKNIKGYCDRNNFIIVREFTDSGSGGDTRKRPEFREMIEFVKNSDIRFIVFDEADRFFRNVEETLRFERELQEKEGIYAVDTWIDNEPRKYLTEGVAVHQWVNRMQARVSAEAERRRIQGRVKEGYKEKAANGLYVGEVVYGLEWKDEHKKYIGYKEDEAQIVKVIFQLYASGNFGYTTLARHLNEMGYVRQVPKIEEVLIGGGKVQQRKLVDSPFTNDVIRGILKNRSFIGRQNTGHNLPLKTLDEGQKETFLESLIEEEEFNYVGQLIQKNTRGKPAQRIKKTSRQKSVFLLQGIGFSAVNGEKLNGDTETNKRTGVKKRRYMVSTNRKGSEKPIALMLADDVERKMIELMRDIKINDLHTIEAMLRETIETEALASKDTTGVTGSSEAQKLKRAIKTLKEIQQTSYSHHTDSTIKTYEKQLNALAKKRTVEEMKFYDLQVIGSVLRNIHTEFKQMQNLAQQEQLIKILFSEFFVGQRNKLTKMDNLKFFHGPTRAEVKTEAKELKVLLQKFFPYLFEKIYVKKDKSILKISFTPTGLFLLLTEKPVKIKDNVGFNYDPHGGHGRNRKGTLPAHHPEISSGFRMSLSSSLLLQPALISGSLPKNFSGRLVRLAGSPCLPPTIFGGPF